MGHIAPTMGLWYDLHAPWYRRRILREKMEDGQTSKFAVKLFRARGNLPCDFKIRRVVVDLTFLLLMSGSSISRPKQLLFVDVPPSPFPLSRYSSISRKENAPLTTASPLSRKRKLSDPEGSSITSTKKQRLVPKSPLKTSSIPEPLASASNTSADFPNGFIYCHQCSQKRDISGECIQPRVANS
jgi:hypothetical protein